MPKEKNLTEEKIIEGMEKSKYAVIGILTLMPVLTLFIYGYFLPYKASQSSNPSSIFIKTVIFPILYLAMMTCFFIYGVFMLINYSKLKKMLKK